MDMMFVIALLAVEGEKYEAEHVKRSEQCGEQPDYVERLAAVNFERRAEDGILREETGERRETRNGERGDKHGPVSDFDFLAEAAHVAHVLLAAHGMNHGACHGRRAGHAPH